MCFIAFSNSARYPIHPISTVLDTYLFYEKSSDYLDPKTIFLLRKIIKKPFIKTNKMFN